MRYKVLILVVSAVFFSGRSIAQQVDLAKLKVVGYQLEDVMEIIDTTELKVKLSEVERQFHQNPSTLNKARLGIIYHETALNLAFLTQTAYKGYAKRSFDILTELSEKADAPKELMPYITSYSASALALVAAETGNLKLLADAFDRFEDAVLQYGEISYLPEFLRGSVAENLPWFFFSKRKFANRDFQSIITKQERDPGFANWKIMSFTYWAWALQHQRKKYREQALNYLDKAIILDPEYKAGRKRAEALKNKLEKSSAAPAESL